MKPPPSAWLLASLCLILTACNYDVPLTDKPTRKIEPRLLGEWVAVNKEDANEELMHVRKLDEATYVVGIDKDIYRVCHTDFAGVALISAQDLNSDERKYAYYRWALSANGDNLSLWSINSKVVPEETKGRAAIQKLIKANLANPQLYGEELLFTRKRR